MQSKFVISYRASVFTAIFIVVNAFARVASVGSVDRWSSQFIDTSHYVPISKITTDKELVRRFKIIDSESTKSVVIFRKRLEMKSSNILDKYGYCLSALKSGQIVPAVEYFATKYFESLKIFLRTNPSKSTFDDAEVIIPLRIGYSMIRGSYRNSSILSMLGKTSRAMYEQVMTTQLQGSKLTRAQALLFVSILGEENSIIQSREFLEQYLIEHSKDAECHLIAASAYSREMKIVTKTQLRDVRDVNPQYVKALEHATIASRLKPGWVDAAYWEAVYATYVDSKRAIIAIKKYLNISSATDPKEVVYRKWATKYLKEH